MSLFFLQQEIDFVPEELETVQEGVLEITLVLLILDVEVVADGPEEVLDFFLFVVLESGRSVDAQELLYFVQFLQRESEVGPSGYLELHSAQRVEHIFFSKGLFLV